MVFALLAIVIVAVVGIAVVYFMFPSVLGLTDNSNNNTVKTPNTVIPSSIDEQPKTGLDTKQIAQDIHKLVNEKRAENGIKPLAWDSRLAPIAEAHSVDMVTRNYYDHVSPDGKDHRDRYQAVGISCLAYFKDGTYDNGSENLAKLSGQISSDNIAERAVNAWMTSTQGHRENVLAPEWTSEGIAVAISGDVAYVTENFC